MLAPPRLLVLLAVGLLPSCVGLPRLALNSDVASPGLLFFIVLWLAALSMIVVLTGLVVPLHRRHHQLLPPLAHTPEELA